MSELFTAANTSNSRTWNGMKTNSTSLSPLTDLFYKIGSARGKFDTVVSDIAASIAEDKDALVRILLWTRDVRTGAGERQTFRDAIDFLATNEFLTLDEALRIMKRIPELGRWDDLKVFENTVLESNMLVMWMNAIVKDGNGLAAKWAPRKGALANKLRKAADLSPRDYRKTIVAQTAVVEQNMCSGDWDNINFSHVPSVAAGRLQKAFGRNAPEAYEAYKAELVKPVEDREKSVKINAGAVYPYDVIRSLCSGDVTVANAQWDALPDFMAGSDNAGILPMVDVSGSMYTSAGGRYEVDRNKGPSCLDVAVSIGLYVSERNRGIFRDEFMTFSETPALVRTKGTLNERYHQMSTADWSFNTNVIAGFNLILDAAKGNNLPEADMPRTLLILSDMQFDQCARFDDSAIESVSRKYHDAGYERPNVVFWNINSSGNGVPVSSGTSGTALVSGFSPSIMASILSCDDFTPEAMMRKTIMHERYNW